ncbi:MAG: SDR family NAD(P)-dependent oxidoreductase [bacterium]|nr:SDR family NAD(P)-dependent oxidoreductase [bacterium]
MDLKNKTAIITGASSGIGRATAETLAQAGMNLVLNGRRADRLDELTAVLGKGVAVPGDISDPAMPSRLLQTAIDSFGGCDVVINNAAVMTVGPIAEIDVDKVCEMARINVEAAFRMAYTVLKYFMEKNAGYLLNLSSILGTKVRPTTGAYAGTKYAIEALTEALRMETAKTGVTVACVEPGLVKTELHREWEVQPAQSLDIPRPLLPEDIARVIRFMLEQPDHVRIPRVMVLPSDHSI